MSRSTVWVFGDQLNRRIGALAEADPARTTVLLVEATEQVAAHRYHRQRLHLVLAAMRRFAAELAAAGFRVDHRQAPTLLDGLEQHRAEHRPTRVVATEPLSWYLRRRVADAGVELVRTDQFLCHYEDFAAWAEGRRRLVMEDFYRWQRHRLDLLMDGERPEGGRWNFDAENRLPPPRDGRRWPAPVVDELDDLDRAVLADLPPSAFGADPSGLWATDRAGALRRLAHVVDEVLPGFGPYEDAMLRAAPEPAVGARAREAGDGEAAAGAGDGGRHTWRMAHSALSHALNLGLLLPGEVGEAVERAYREGRVPLASAEGFLRQVIGWREYVWGVYWLWMPEYRGLNELGADRPVPPLFHHGPGATRMRCVAEALDGVEQRAWAHHIQRLMVLSNLALLAGVEPSAMVEWMSVSFIDGSEWVMLPNLVGMGLHADGGRMATKPYAAGGAYINRMSDYCGACPYRPTKRVGEDACPFTTLYWDFLARHRDRLGGRGGNRRLAQPYANLDRLGDLPAVRRRARQVLELLDSGEL